MLSLGNKNKKRTHGLDNRDACLAVEGEEKVKVEHVNDIIETIKMAECFPLERNTWKCPELDQTTAKLDLTVYRLCLTLRMF